MDFGDKEIVSL